MSNERSQEQLIRSYLLGGLPADESLRVEERLMTDNAFDETVNLVEGELIDDYVMGILTGDDRERFEAVYLSTAVGRKRVEFAEAMRNYALKRAEEARRPSRVKGQRPAFLRPLSNPVLQLVAASVILCLAGVGVWRLFFYTPEVEKGLLALGKAYDRGRPLEARISGFRYAPSLRTRGGQEYVDSASRDRAERILLDAIAENPNPTTRHALGRLYLAEKKFDQAIALFEAALAADPNNAQLHGDLGAALLEKGKADRSDDVSGKSLEEFARSVEHFNKALEVNGNLLEALFNRALLYQEMRLPQKAAEDWRKYLEKDPTSGWADEARQHLSSLEEQNKATSDAGRELLQEFIEGYRTGDDERAWKALSRSRSRTGNLVVQSSLANYLRSRRKGSDGDAEHELRMIAYAGELEFRKAGDRFTLDLSSFYSVHRSQEVTELARAQEILRQAHKDYNQSDLETAIREYGQARSIFRQAGDACEALITEYWIGFCYFQQPNTAESLSIFTRLADVCESKKYLWILSVSFNSLANLCVRFDEYSKAIDYYNRALKLSEEISDENGILLSFERLAGSYFYVGRYQDSLGSVEKGLTLAEKLSASPTQVVAIYATGAADFNELGFYEAALNYLQESVRLGIETQNPRIISRYYAQLGAVYAKLKIFDAAVASIEAGFRAGERLKDQPTGQELMAYAHLKLAETYTQAGDTSKAIDIYDEVIQFYSHFENPDFLFRAHKGRLVAYIAQRDNTSAEEELRCIFELFEQFRSKIWEENNRNTFFDVEQNIYDTAIEYAYSSRHDPQRAFDYSESSKARSLLDLASTHFRTPKSPPAYDLGLYSSTPVLKLADIQKRLPEETQILQYAALESKLLIWVVSKSSFSSFEEEITTKELNRKITDYLQKITETPAHSEDEIRSLSMALYDLLIKPVEGQLDATKRICIVPDKVLNYVPFGALLSAPERYLVEEYNFVLSPSADVFLLCSDSATRKETQGTERLLSVGGTGFDRRAFPDLAEIASADKEAKTIASFYSSEQLLTGSEATRERVIEGIKNSEVIHLALHYLVDERSPRLSKLLLARDPKGPREVEGSDGTLRVDEIYGLKMTRAKLIVLSACQTAIERCYKGEGSVGISRPFLAVGVPLVIASLWPVDSDSTADLMITFHKYRRQKGLPTAEALRRAQLSMINGPRVQHRNPYYWAAFVVIGGYAKF